MLDDSPIKDIQMLLVSEKPPRNEAFLMGSMAGDEVSFRVSQDIHV